MARLTEAEYFKITGKTLPQKSSKYRNEKSWGYDSKKEASRATQLKNEERLGIIKNLKEQVTFELQPSFRIPKENKQGFETMRAIKYIADFTYDRIGETKTTVEDTKGFKTKEYQIKKKLFLYKLRDKYNFIET